MKSLREFVSKELVLAIEDDARRFRIFNEADLQYRVATHLDRKFVGSGAKFYVVNEPVIRIGRGRGAATAKPDLVFVHKDEGPLAALELKCFLESSNLRATIAASKIWEDVENLRKFKQRFGGSLNSFAIVLLDLPDVEEYLSLLRELRRERQPWMSHYLHIRVINMYCQNDGRKRVRYKEWANEWLDRLDRIRGYGPAQRQSEPKSPLSAVLSRLISG